MGKFLFILCLCGPLFARIVYVPAQFGTIQEGLESLFVNDTLLVALGTYEEALIAPAIPFTMLGAIDSISGNWSGPFVNASNLELPDTTAALALPRFSDVRIENFGFMNSHRYCIRSWADNLTLVNCQLDSAYRWLLQVQDSIGALVDLQDCVFRNVELSGVIVRAGNMLRAKRCKFSGGEYHDPRSLVSASKSEIDSCNFSDVYGHSLLGTNRDSHRITNCTFGPAVTIPFETAVSLGRGSIEFSHNLIIDCSYGNHAVRIDSELPDSVRITDNVFIRCTGQSIGLMAAGALGLLYYPASVTHGARIQRNTFIDCAGHVTADDIWPFVGYPALIENNRFVHDSINGLPSIGGSGGPWQSMPHTMRYNFFENCGYALDGSVETDARFNYWSDPSGPFNEFAAPNGAGDTVTGPVQLAPWLTDTTAGIGADLPEVVTGIPLLASPNPFNSSVTIEYAMVREQRVRLDIHDVLGRLVETLVDEQQSIGVHSVMWNAGNHSTGLYFARLNAGGFAQSVKLLHLK
ncbi:T9SS type A sorting domain-containing protein [bacterium]|nr:T9SS type A sorting domain-containing protein [bacterium]